ncbi:MAG TPA: PDZ domain-containing protein [Candidatus Eisenbacteria bacterium]|nr:PDZ domain-containing protein [Candidatus Eisenbacteria bacterium]
MRRLVCALILTAAVGGVVPVSAAERCPLDLSTCLMEFAKMRERPWVGVLLDQDTTTGVITVVQVHPEGPAAKAGWRVGDQVIGLEGLPPAEGRQMLAGKAGWKTGAEVHYRIKRGKREMNTPIRLGQMTDEQLAGMIGEHMVEAHLAYADATSGVH